jgi:hypothetical protein
VPSAIAEPAIRIFIRMFDSFGNVRGAGLAPLIEVLDGAGQRPAWPMIPDAAAIGAALLAAVMRWSCRYPSETAAR